jgi:hypothetical protein
MNVLQVEFAYQALIHEVRGYKVMLEYDLASLYGVETKRLKEQVKRNISRFPADFIFEINQDEFTFLRSQISTSKRGGTRYFPMAFTEQGGAILSSVLNAEKAIQVNIGIMRAFADYRALLLESKEFRKELRRYDEKIDRLFKFLLNRMDAQSQKPPDNPRKTIGFKINHDE